MEVILLEKVRNLGNLGDKVNVKAGYGRNFLIPGGQAVMATADNLVKFEERRAELEKAMADSLAAAEARATQLEELAEVTIPHQAGDEGKLFGSVTNDDIAKALTAAGAAVEKRDVKMPDGPIREVGDHSVDIQLHSDVVQAVTIKVVAE
ncbi:MAG: 50S ribosomal protein L9 [Gammaproteobacteria bacterium]|nr:50S ribosomal protein L9 [Gammaproteobacteria bacterium]